MYMQSFHIVSLNLRMCVCVCVWRERWWWQYTQTDRHSHLSLSCLCVSLFMRHNLCLFVSHEGGEMNMKDVRQKERDKQRSKQTYAIESKGIIDKSKHPQGSIGVQSHTHNQGNIVQGSIFANICSLSVPNTQYNLHATMFNTLWIYSLKQHMLVNII